MRSDNVKGHRPGSDPPPSKVERVGRICREPDCDTRLSIYNKTGMCWQHQPLIFPNYRGKRLANPEQTPSGHLVPSRQAAGSRRGRPPSC